MRARVRIESVIIIITSILQPDEESGHRRSPSARLSRIVRVAGASAGHESTTASDLARRTNIAPVSVARKPLGWAGSSTQQWSIGAPAERDGSVRSLAASQRRVLTAVSVIVLCWWPGIL